MEIALYAPNSSDDQRDTSIKDHLRGSAACTPRSNDGRWSTATRTGRSWVHRPLRPGIQELISDAMSGSFAVVLAEAMDRLSRDREHIAGLFKRMAFAGVGSSPSRKETSRMPRRAEGQTVPPREKKSTVAE